MNAVHAVAGSSAALDVAAIRRDFPVLERTVRGLPLSYLDNAASSQRPRAVIDAMSRYYETSHANVHRGVHTLSQEATDLFEGAREKVRRFINAKSTTEIIFVRGTTEAINLVAQSYGRPTLGPGDEILISWLEHHANIVPWQMLCQQTGATLQVAPITRSGEVDFDAFAALLSPRTKLVALAHVSNALGTIIPVSRFIAAARTRGVPVLLDGAQAVPHMTVDVQALNCDFYAFSGHKMCGPTGIGVLYGRESLLSAMPPWQGGGDMILAVSFEKTVYNGLPYKFEAGTPDIAGAIGLGAAIDYLEALGMERIAAAEHALLDYANERLATVPGLRFVGTAPDKAAVVSFTLDRVHPHDLGTILDHEGVAIRTGHHCAMPVMDFFGLPATARASFAFYNTPAEIERLVAALLTAREMLG
ncbi:MAG: cysteine desulfurase [Steroidobacteraceae bacterium]|nr:cysteine desulfurase [Steroidobacteraceae bacterium]MBP7013020.1 cysteine desulfurase [Steroidobacteraceae bacterium]